MSRQLSTAIQIPIPASARLRRVGRRFIRRAITEEASARSRMYGQNNLGVMYYGGEGVPQDYAEAVKWYRKAADQGYAPAQAGLGAVLKRRRRAAGLRSGAHVVESGGCARVCRRGQTP
jgi:TPR repeat protein